MNKKRKLGIVGVGPRGGHALERFIAQLAQQNRFSNIQIVLFEATGNFGDGHVYNTNQTESNWINITERILELQERKTIQTPILEVPGFPSYHDWIDKNLSDKVDAFPPRAKIGSYLNQRFSSLIAPLEALGHSKGQNMLLQFLEDPKPLVEICVYIVYIIYIYVYNMYIYM